MSKSGRATSRATGRAKKPTQSSPPSLGIVIGALVVIIAVGGIIWMNRAQASSIEGVVYMGVQQRGHANGKLAFNNTPPVGGIHNATWQNCGIYDQPIANENGVHSMEHGATWITYDPSLPADSVEKLRSLIRGRPYTLMSPYQGLPSPIVISAWSYQLQVTDPNDPRLPQFISQYTNGTQTPEPGASCSGGTGQPIG